MLRGTAIAATLLASASVQADLFRSYLASDGNDANPCTLAAPCRLLPRALTVVASGGEIWMLDSANYNTAQVEIAKSVTILAIPGALGSVVAAGGNAINIATPGVKVALRNLVIVPLPAAGGTNGISLSNGLSLTVEGCLVANLPGTGILASAGSVRVTDSTIRDNGVHGISIRNGARATVTRAAVSGNGDTGIHVYGGVPGTLTTADVSESSLDVNTANGAVALSDNGTAAVKVSMRNSRSVQSPGNGAVSRSEAGAAVTFSISNSTIANNGAGIVAQMAGSKVWASGNTVSDNAGAGLANSSGVFETAGNNAVRNNGGGDTSGAIAVVATR
jgi:hypothetical protein